MKTQEQRDVFTPLTRMYFVVSLLLGLTMMPRLALAQPGIQTRSIGEIITTYDSLETELLRRFETQIKNHDSELTQTAMALAHIGSKRAVPLFLDNITVVPGSPAARVGEFYPVQIVKGSNYKNTYVMLVALLRLGSVSLEQCISEIDKAQDKSLRETLLAHLGQELHGKAFANEMRSRASSPEGKEKWGRLLSLLPRE